MNKVNKIAALMTLVMIFAVAMAWASAPTVVINQDTSQRDPTNGDLLYNQFVRQITYRAVFDQPVFDFDANKVLISGTAPGNITASVAQANPYDGTVYVITITGMGTTPTDSGTVIVSIPAGSARNAAGEYNVSSYSTDNQVTWDVTPPSVIVVMGDGIQTPSNGIDCSFKLLFSEPVFGGAVTRRYEKRIDYNGDGYKDWQLMNAETDDYSDISFELFGVAIGPSGPGSGAGAGPRWWNDLGGVWGWLDLKPPSGFPEGPLITITGTGSLRVLYLPGIPYDGPVYIKIHAGWYSDEAGNTNTASADPYPGVVFDRVMPTCSIEQAPDQPDPTNGSTIKYIAQFTEPVKGFDNTTVTVSGTAFSDPNLIDIQVQELYPNNNTKFVVFVTGMDQTGDVVANIPAAVVTDLATNPNIQSNSSDNVVSFFDGPSVVIAKADTQNNPTNRDPILFKAVFDRPVGMVDASMFVVSGTSSSALSISGITGTGTAIDPFIISVTGMQKNGTVTLRLLQNAINNNLPSNTAVIDYDKESPVASIAKASTQESPTSSTIINFVAMFSKKVIGFTKDDVILSGTALPSDCSISEIFPNNGTTFAVAVRGMTQSGIVNVQIPSDIAVDLAGNLNFASGIASVAYSDANAPKVTVDKAASQANPTNGLPINFSVVFSEAVSGFTASDVLISSTAPGNLTAVVTGSGSTYNVAISGLTDTGTVTLNIPAGAAKSISRGLDNVASIAVQDTVYYDVTRPSVTINQSVTQDDPTTATTVHFTAVFSKPVNNFTANGVILSGTAGATTKVVTNSGDNRTFNIAVSGYNKEGTIIADIPGSVAQDAIGNGNTPSISNDNTITYSPNLIVTVAKDLSQADPTGVGPIRFVVTFNKDVNDFTSDDVTVFGTAGGLKTIVSTTVNAKTYNIAIDGMTSAGTVDVSVLAGAAHDKDGFSNQASNTATVTFQPAPPNATINQASDQLDPGTGPTVKFTAIFDQAVTGLNPSGINIGGTAGGTTAVVTDSGDGKTFTVLISGMTQAGTVTASINPAAATSINGMPNNPSSSTDNTVTWSSNGPTVTVNQAVNQNDPTSAQPIKFTAVFSAPVTSFASNDVSITGTATGTKTVTIIEVAPNDGTTYQISVSGLTGDGTVIADILANAAADAQSNNSQKSTSTDNSVTFTSSFQVAIKQASGENTPTNLAALHFDITFTQDVTAFTKDKITITNGTVTTLTGSGTNYTATVTPTADGNLTLRVPAGAVTVSNNPNLASNLLAIVSDRTAPVTFVPVADPSIPTNDDVVTITFTTTDATSGIDHYEIAIDNGVYTTQTSPYQLQMTNLTEGEHTVHIKVFDKAGNSLIKDIVVTKTMPKISEFMSFKIVEKDFSDTNTAITNAYVSDKVLVKGKLKLEYNASAGTPSPANGLITIIATKPDGSAVSIKASVKSWIAELDGQEQIGWIGDITPDYTTGEPVGNPALITKDSFKIDSVGEWEFTAHFDGLESWLESDSSDLTIDAGGPQRTVSVENPLDPLTSAPLIDMITPPLFIGNSVNIVELLNPDKTSEMQIAKYDPASNLYSTASFNVKPGEAIWIKPEMSYPDESVNPIGLINAMLQSGNSGFDIDTNLTYKILTVNADDYPVVTDSNGNVVIDSNTGRPKLKLINVRLYPGWNMVGNPFFIFKKGFDGKDVLPREDVGLPVEELKITYLGVTKFINDTSLAKVVKNFLWRWDATSKQYVLVHSSSPAAEKVLKAWGGYWIKSEVTCDLVIDPNTTFNGN